MPSGSKSSSEAALVVLPNFLLKHDRIFLTLILLAGLLLRLDFLFANRFVIDSDEAIVGLMAKHILEGRDFPIFYYGQHYMGSLEAFFAAGLFAVVGISSVALKVVPLVCSLLFVVLLYQIGLELGSRGVARLAALFAALPPQLLVLWSSMARGGYMEILCIGGFSIVLLLRWLRTSRPTELQTAAIAAFLGLGWWVNNQILYFILPSAFCIATSLYSANRHSLPDLFKSLLRHSLAAAVAFLIGGAPFWIYNLRHHFVSFEIVKASDVSAVSEHTEGLLSTSLPMLLGARRQWHKEDVFPGASQAAFGLYGLLLVYLLWKRRFGLKALCAFQISRRDPVELFMLLLMTIVAVFVTSSFGSLVQSPRYLLPAYVSIFVLSACAISLLALRSRILAGALTCGVLLLNVSSWYLGGRALPGEPFIYEGERVSKDHRELIGFLEKAGIDFVRTNYWIGYRLAFETKERVRFAIFHEPKDVRIRDYERDAGIRGKSYLPLVLVPSQARVVRRAFDLEGLRYQSVLVSNYEVLYDLHPSELSLVPLESKLLTPSATDGQTAVLLGVDGNPGTRWGSAAPQRPGMEYRIDIAAGETIRGVRYELGTWVHDQPRDLGIDLVLRNGNKRVLLDPDDWEAVRYARDDATSMLFTFASADIQRIILRQMGTQPIFDWSIAEVEVLK